MELLTYTEAARSSLKEALAITAIDIVPAVAAVFLLRVRILDSVGLILLLEGAVLMLIGGALSFARPGVRGVVTLLGILARSPRSERNPSQTSERERISLGDIRAAFYMITGLLLFLESALLAVLISGTH